MIEIFEKAGRKERNCVMLELSRSGRVGFMYNKDVNKIFDVGCFNYIVMGAMVASMERAGLRKSKMVEVMYHAVEVLDELSAEELEKIHSDYLANLR